MEEIEIQKTLGILLLFFWIMLFLKISSEMNNNSSIENFENETNEPTILFLYGNILGQNQEKVKKLFEDNYKNSNNEIQIIEIDVTKKNENELNSYKMNPNMEFEIRYYPSGTKNKQNYQLYLKTIGSELKDYITDIENDYANKKLNDEISAMSNEE
jgi:hypothetical protein